MKKTIGFILSCVFALTCVLSVVVAEDASVNGTLSRVEAKPGETVTVSLSVDTNTAIQSIGFSGLAYDKTALEYQSAEWMLTGGSGKIMDLNKSAIAGVYAFEGTDKEVEGIVLAVNFKILDGAKDGEYAISCAFSVGKVDGTKPTTNLVPGAVIIGISSTMLGDVDLNGKIDATDARLVLRAAAKLDTLTGISLWAADADEDGTVNAIDARKILRAAAKLEDLPKKYSDSKSGFEMDTTREFGSTALSD